MTNTIRITPFSQGLGDAESPDLLPSLLQLGPFVTLDNSTPLSNWLKFEGMHHNHHLFTPVNAWTARALHVSIVLAGLLTLLLPVISRAETRTLAVIEFRAGVSAGRTVAPTMAARIRSLTANRVIGPADARRRLGAGLQAIIADCKGEPACIARIGTKLGAQEVILVGLSQLGDLILAIQRIEVRSGTVLARLADSFSPRRRIRRSAVDGYLRRLLPPEDFLRYGTIIVRSDTDGDSVLLDGVAQGVTPLSPIRVPAPARYTVRIKRPNYNDFITRLHVLPEASVEVRPTLTAKGPGHQRWYQKWWVWAIVGGVVAGGATAAAVTSATQTPSSVGAYVEPWKRR